MIVASLSAAVQALGLTGAAIGVAATSHGQFSGGIAAVLVVYAVLVAAVAWLAWRGVSAATGMLVAIGVLHLLVVVSLARAGGAPLWLVCAGVLALTTIVAGVWAWRRAA